MTELYSSSDIRNRAKHIYNPDRDTDIGRETDRERQRERETERERQRERQGESHSIRKQTNSQLQEL